MSTLTLHRPSGPAPHRLSGLTWTVLRLHRTALYVWAAGLLTVVVALIRLHAAAAAHVGAVGDCDTSEPFPLTCETFPVTTAYQFYGYSLGLISACVTYLAFAVAVWAGAALIGRELENGTAQLAWTQSVTPARWLATRLAVPAVLLTAGTASAVLLTGWTYRAGKGEMIDGWFETNVFVSSGPVAVAYALAGLALGALAGLVLRRALPAAAAALAAAYVLHEALDTLRMHLWPAETITGQAPLPFPRGAMVLGGGTEPGAGGRSGIWATYQPESHFWPLQLVESGLLLALAGLATAAAFALLRRRHA
ncbi:hypothetical protein [Streptomyces sp. NPDC058751]|uniref:hypothetical protein n=1 Tax=Streptomyces sp. NPDC058751 TaxID=3346623 RepID=UPI00368992E4